MKILIVEDEPLAIHRIEGIIRKYRPEWEIAGICQSNKELKLYLEKNPGLDLMLCDIHLADGLSFHGIQGLNLGFPIIFITAYDEYALESFEHNCIDYVLKPIQDKRLLMAFEKVEKLGGDKSVSPLPTDFIQKILNRYDSKSYKKRFLTKMGKKIRFCSVEDVAYFFTEGGITFLVEKHSKGKYIVEHSLNELTDELLDPSRFFRINRSVIINLDSLEEMKPHINGRLVLSMNVSSSSEIIVSRERVNEFKNWINQ